MTSVEEEDGVDAVGREGRRRPVMLGGCDAGVVEGGGVKGGCPQAELEKGGRRLHDGSRCVWW